MKKDFTELKEEIRDEVLSFLVRRDINLSNNKEVNDALEDFYSETIVQYMDDNKLELGYSLAINDDNEVLIDIWEW